MAVVAERLGLIVEPAGAAGIPAILADAAASERDTTMSTAVDNLAMRIRDMVSLAVEEENVTLTDVAFTFLTAAIATLSAVERAEETATLLSGIAKRLEK
jgi:hypothetical protein